MPSTMTERKKQRPTKGRARERGDSVYVGVEVDPRLDAALEACAAKDLRSKKAVITLALQEYLGKNGLWPPPQQHDIADS